MFLDLALVVGALLTARNARIYLRTRMVSYLLVAVGGGMAVVSGFLGLHVRHEESLVAWVGLVVGLVVLNTGAAVAFTWDSGRVAVLAGKLGFRQEVLGAVNVAPHELERGPEISGAAAAAAGVGCLLFTLVWVALTYRRHPGYLLAAIPFVTMAISLLATALWARRSR